MPFYIRQSVSAGPFRFNFSKSGVGVSIGVKGLRIGKGPRGHYIHAGRGGLYYRATLGQARGSRPSAVSSQSQRQQKETSGSNQVAMIPVESGDVMHMREESFSELLHEINSKAAQVRLSAALCWIAIAIGVVAGFATGGPGLVMCAGALPAWAIGRWLDSYRRTSVLYYELEGDAEAAYCRLAEGFDRLIECAGKWHIEAGGVVQTLTVWKRNAGASHLVDRKDTTLIYKLPTVIKSNVTPPALHVGRQIMFFMPDVLLIKDGSHFGAVNYADLNFRWQESRFIESGHVPNDARIVGHTWKHPNKSGGPDRRFKDNRQIPVCLYETMHLTSRSGVNELVEFSRTGVVAGFVDGCRMLAALPREVKGIPPATMPNYAAGAAGTSGTKPQRGAVTISGWMILGALVGGLMLGAIQGPDKDGHHTASPPLGGLQTSTSRSMNVSAPAEATEPNATQVDILGTQDPISSSPLPSLEEGGLRLSTRFTKSDVNLRQGPSTKFSIITVVPRGVAVSVIETNGAWSRVAVNSGVAGWMANSTLGDR